MKILFRSNSFDPSDESTPKMNRMLTRHQLVVQQTSPNKKRKINSNSFDDELIHIYSFVFLFSLL